MRIWIFLAVAVIFAGTPQGVTGVEKEKVSLPNEVNGWRWDGKDRSYNARTIFDYIDGAGELFLAYNFRGVTVRRLEKPGKPALVAELYDMGAPGDAYGVFSFERQDEEAGIGQGSEFGGGLLRFWKGRYFVSVYGEGDGPEMESAILALGKEVAASVGPAGPPPKLLAALPNGERGLVGRTIRYLHSHILLNQRFYLASQNILNLNPRTEAVLGQYLRYGKKTHLLVIRYPTIEDAEAAMKSFRNAYMPEAEVVRTEDRTWTAARRSEGILAIVFGASSEEEARQLLKATETKVGEMRNG
jgi:hypothetical protein